MSKTAFETLSRFSGFQGAPSEFFVAGIDTDDGPDHPLFDADSNATKNEDLEPLVLAMCAEGFIGTVTITKLGGRPFIVDGRRRCRAARIADARLRAAGRPGLVVKGVQYQPGEHRDRDLLGAVIASNEHRRAKSPLERARQAARLQQLGATVDEVAVVFGVSGQAVRGWNDLLTLAPAVQKKVETGEVKASTARALKNLDDRSQEKAIADLMASGGKVTRAKAKDAARSNGSAGAPAPSMRGKKEVRSVMDRYDLPAQVVLALSWVIGEIDEAVAFGSTPAAPERPTTTPASKRGAKPAGTDGFTVDDVPEAS